MTADEQQLAALLQVLPGRAEVVFWRRFKKESGVLHMKGDMSRAVQKAKGGDAQPLADLVLKVFDREARLEDAVKVLATPLGSELRARAWITSAVAAALRVSLTSVEKPLDGLAKKW